MVLVVVLVVVAAAAAAAGCDPKLLLAAPCVFIFPPSIPGPLLRCTMRWVCGPPVVIPTLVCGRCR